MSSLTESWIAEYRARRDQDTRPTGADTENTSAKEPPFEVPKPNEIQEEALEALSETRLVGNRSGLVVMATGIGKTWLAAFDVASDREEFGRVLFVAHREEILTQSLSTFRKINPRATMGLYNGIEKLADSEILFASVQTLSRPRHLEVFKPTDFDYIIIDEFHHAAATTYRRIIDYFQPKFMLGLTATPERTDGGDLLALCDENLVYRCDVPRGIDVGLLCAYRYFGVPDSIDYQNIPWRSRKFDEHALTQAAETQERANNIYEQWQKHGADRTLAFCVSKSHANFMRQWFLDKGVLCAAVHSGSESDPRSISLEKLNQGDLSVVFAVDMFNEGVDLPSLDTVMMLRPTESSIIWLQQFGRGLRKQGEKVLTVIDYIGNHRSFLLKIRALLNMQQGGDAAIREALLSIKEGRLVLPAGCEVTYDLESIDILEALLQKSKTEVDALELYYKEFREQHGQRPTATETYHDGYLPVSARKSYGSWMELVKAMGDLDEGEQLVLQQHSALLKGLETTNMSRSYKMVLLRALLNLDAIPGEGESIENLSQAVEYIVNRSSRLAQDFGNASSSIKALETSLINNPIAAWTGARALGGEVVFEYQDSHFRYLPDVSDQQKVAFQKMLRELIEWRLAVYLDRPNNSDSESSFDLLVSNASSKPILLLPERSENSDIPVGLVDVQVGERMLVANFSENSIDSVAEGSESSNILPTVLREWFGTDAGLPGTNFIVRCESSNSVLSLVPQLRAQDTELVPFKRYAREQIPKLFGESFNPGKWNSGHILSPTGNPTSIILLVTLEKQDMTDEHQYQDRFLSPTLFQWQSQNSTKKGSPRGKQLREHADLGLSVHLFVRKNKKEASRAAPFVYCGEVGFQQWEGDAPITIQWNLRSELPNELYNLFNG